MNPISKNFSLTSLIYLLILIPIFAFSQSTGMISGKIVDSSNNEPLVGANVFLEGTSLGAATDLEGKYYIYKVPAGNYKLVISYLGYNKESKNIGISSGEKLEENFSLGSTILEGQEIVVTAQRVGQARALNRQRTSDNIKNIVSSDLMGRFPDPNAAEALQRIPGISIQRDQGEGRYVLIRGMAARLNAVTVNNERLPSPEGEIRSVALDVIPADIVSSLEVHKALKPDMDADAIGGSINLITKSANDYSGPTFKATAAGGYNSLVSDNNFQGALTYANRFGSEKKLGFLISGSYYKTNRGSDNNEFTYGEEDFGNGDEIVLNRLELRDYLVTRTRLGISSTVDYKLNDNSMLYLRGIYNDYDDTEERRRLYVRPDKGDYISRTSVSEGRIYRDFKDRFEGQKIISITGGGKHFLNSINLDYQLSYSYAEEEEPDRSDIAFVQKKMDMSWSLADPDFPTYQITNNKDQYEASAYEIDEYVVENNLTTDKDITGQINLSMPYSLSSGSGELKLGAKFRSKNKDRKNNVDIYSWEGADDYTMDMVLGDFEDDKFLKDKYRIGLFSDKNDVKSFFKSHRSDFELDEEGSIEDTEPANYDAAEKILAAYAQTKLILGNIMILGGLRFEKTDLEYTGNKVTFDENGDLLPVTSVTEDNNYSNLFPMVHLKYSLNEDTNIRAAWTNSIARPNYYSLVPYAIINREDQEMERGNSALKPTLAMNLDFMFEHYIRPLGIISGGIFYKNLNDFIYPEVTKISGGTYDGYEVEQVVNGESATLFGFEINMQKQLTSLPGALSGLGIYANYTYTDSKAKFPNRDEDMTLPGQATHVANFAVSYDRGGFSGRISLNYHGKYIDEVAESTDWDEYYDNHTQLDISFSQKIMENISFFGELINLTNSPLRYYYGVTTRPKQQEYYKWWSHFGLKFDF